MSAVVVLDKHVPFGGGGLTYLVGVGHNGVGLGYVPSIMNGGMALVVNTAGNDVSISLCVCVCVCKKPINCM